jgi:hypothetical protein
MPGDFGIARAPGSDASAEAIDANLSGGARH